MNCDYFEAIYLANKTVGDILELMKPRPIAEKELIIDGDSLPIAFYYIFYFSEHTK